MNNKTVIAIVGGLLGITLVYLIYKAVTSGGSSKSVKDQQKDAAEKKKASKADPTNKVLAEAAIQAALDAYNAMSSSKKGGKNSDGSSATQGTSANGVPMTVVNSEGDYIENDDPTTLYDKSGNPIGDLDAESGFFLDANGHTIASADGSLVKNIDSYGNYQDDNGDWYSADGTPIVLHANGIYTELDNNTDVFDMSGNVIGKLNGDGTYIDVNTGDNISLD